MWVADAFLFILFLYIRWLQVKDFCKDRSSLEDQECIKIWNVTLDLLMVTWFVIYLSLFLSNYLGFFFLPILLYLKFFFLTFY